MVFRMRRLGGSFGGSLMGFFTWPPNVPDTLEVMSEWRIMAKFWAILDNISHPLHESMCALGSSFSNRLHHVSCSKERFHRSFVLAADSHRCLFYNLFCCNTKFLFMGSIKFHLILIWIDSSYEFAFYTVKITYLSVKSTHHPWYCAS